MRASKNVPISSSSRLSSSSVSQTARRRRNPIERVCPFVESETRGFVCVVRIRPSARLHARIRALARSVRDHSSLSRGHRRRGHEPLCSRSRCVVMEAIHSLIHSFTHSLIYSFIHSFIRSLTHSLIHSFIHVARLVDRARDSFRGRVTPPLASPRHLDERVDTRDSSRRAVKTNRHEK